jgi:hypothetical protein
MGVSGQHHAPAALLPPGKGPPVPIGQEADHRKRPLLITNVNSGNQFWASQLIYRESKLLGSYVSLQQ